MFVDGESKSISLIFERICEKTTETWAGARSLWCANGSSTSKHDIHQAYHRTFWRISVYIVRYCPIVFHSLPENFSLTLSANTNFTTYCRRDSGEESKRNKNKEIKIFLHHQRSSFIDKFLWFPALRFSRWRCKTFKEKTSKNRLQLGTFLSWFSTRQRRGTFESVRNSARRRATKEPCGSSREGTGKRKKKHFLSRFRRFLLSKKKNDFRAKYAFFSII